MRGRGNKRRRVNAQVQPSAYVREEESSESTLREGDAVGDVRWTDKEGVVRLAFQNVQGFGFDKRARKFKSIYQFVKKYAVDMIGMAEANTFWPKVKTHLSLYERTKEWFEARHLKTSYNQKDIDAPRFQPGGVATMTVDKLAYKVVESGEDSKKLGRWTWIRLRGRNDKHLRVATVYRPCVPSAGSNRSQGSFTVHCQHMRGLLKDGDTRLPRRALMEDLQEEVAKWKETGDSVIIMGDFNEDVRNDYCKQWRDNLGLRDAVIDRIGSEYMPATHIRGSEPIDSIWLTANIEVKRIMVMPQEDGVGDHRPILMDIVEESVFGYNILPVPSMRARRLKYNDPRIVKKYLQLLSKYYKDRDFYKKVYDISLIPIEYPLQTALRKQYEQLDRIRSGGMKFAERKCRKFRCGKIPWSPEITCAHNYIEMWHLIIRRLDGRNVSARTILRARDRCRYEGEIIATRDQASKELKQAYELYSQAMQFATENRATFLEDLAAARAKEGKTKASVELSLMRRREKVKESWRRIHRMDGSARKPGGLQRIISPDHNGEWTEKVTKEDVERGTLQENERRFTQANGTPMTISPLLEEFGKLGNGPQADNLLRGQYTSHGGIDAKTEMILQHLKTKEGIIPAVQPIPISREELAEGWKRVKERTSSSPSGLHIGHWKAGCDDPGIHWINTTMINIPYMSGYSPKRWQIGLNVMLEKISGNCRVDKLRTILLYEADFNMMNKYIGKTMMKYAEDHDLISKVQYGGRKRRAANGHALNKRLFFDKLRQTRKKGAVCSCDLKSCYDRIVHAFAALAMRRAGVAETATVSMFQTIQNLIHKVRTAFGDSDESFGGEWWRELETLLGVGQGNGAGPAIWAVISSIFFDVLKSQGFGAILTAPFSKEILELEGFGFVDDTDILQTGLNFEDYREITGKLQAALELWEKCTEISGGCLVPDKSWWTIIDFTWEKGRWKYVKEFEEAELRIKDAQGINRPLKLLQPNEAQKMLGVWLAPDGNNEKQIEVMRDKAVKWAEKVRTGHTTKSDAWQALTMSIMKKLDYSLIALTLTEQECKTIMAPVLEIGLGRAGICQKISRKVLYGSRELQGMGLHNLFTTLGISHVQAFLEHTWKKSLTGKLMLSSLESLQLEIGVEGGIFTRDYKLYGHLGTDCWLKHLWKFCCDHKITIEEKCESPGIIRTRDKMLNECWADAWKGGIISKADWKKANFCRLYLQVMSVGEISTGDGRKISSNSWEGKRVEDFDNDIEWPERMNPTSVDWAAWRRVLTASLCSGEDLRLTIPLGVWLHTTKKRFKSWKWFWDYRSKVLYKRHGRGFLKYNNTYEGRRTRASQNGFLESSWVPGDLIEGRLERTTVYIDSNGIYPEGSAPIQDEEREPRLQVTENIRERLEEDLENMKGNRWAIKQVTTTNSIDSIVQDIQTGTLVGVSDGSFKDGIGTACFIIENLQGTERIIGVIDVPGHEDEQDAYRSELAGLFGILTVLKQLEKYCGSIMGHVIVACDGKGALFKAFDSLNNVSTKCPHFDLLGGIHHLRKELKCTLLPVHVKGHQDDNPKTKIDRLGVLNIECDLRAKLFWSKIQPGYRRSNFTIVGTFWKLRVCGLLVGTNSGDYLRMSIEGAKVLDYWVEKKRFPQAYFRDIDIHGIHKASKLISWERQRWIAKFLSGWCATGSKMLKWKKRLVDRCPRCGHKKEDNVHILECKASEVLEIWEKEFKKLDRWLCAEETCPQLRKTLIESLRAWKMGCSKVTSETHTYTGIKVGIVSQSRLGWRRLVEGTFTMKWREIQDHYYKSMNIPKSSDAWVARLIVKMWDIIFVIWQHRNSVLHGTSLVELMEGSYALDQALRKEWDEGFDGLPATVRAILPESIMKAMEGTTRERKGWFVLVRRARELLPNYEGTDEFADPKSSLRKWAGF